MDEKILAQVTVKSLREASKLTAGAETGLGWVMMVVDEEGGSRTIFAVAKAFKPDVKAAVKEHRKGGGKWGRGSVTVGAGGLVFVIEDGKKLPAKEATRTLRTDTPDLLAAVKPILKAAEFGEAVATEQGESEGEESDANHEARCDRARDQAKEAFLAVKGVATKELLDHLVEVREKATKARQAGDLEEATELYLDLVARAKAVKSSLGVDPKKLLEGWRAAMETVDGQLAGLVKALRESGDDELREIAEFGVSGLTRGHKVPLQGALLSASTAEGVARVDALEKVAGLASEFASFLETDEAVAAVDENPFGVKVDLRGTLLPTLQTLASAAG